MNILSSARANLADIGVEQLQPLETSPSIWTTIKSVLVFISFSLRFITLIVFLLAEAVTFRDYCECIYSILVDMMGFIIFLIFLWYSKDCFILMDNLRNVIQKRLKSPESKAIYVEMDKRIETWCEAVNFSLFKGTVLIVEVAVPVKSYFLYLTTDLGRDAFSCMFAMWLPFDWKTPFMYPIAYVIEFAQLYCVALVSACFFNCLIGFCVILITFADELRSEVKEINDSVKSNASPLMIMRKFTEFIDFQVTANELASDVAEIYSLIILTIFVWSLLASCSIMLVLQAEITADGMNIKLVAFFPLLSWSLLAVFIFCEASGMVTSRFAEILYDIEQCDWYLFPAKIQKMLPIIIQYTQQPVIFRAFGKASCTRDAFKNVANSGFSYFLMLRKFQI